MKDIPIGGYFAIGNEVYKCVSDDKDGCRGCDISMDKCSDYACHYSERADGESSSFILYDDTTADTQQDD